MSPPVLAQSVILKSMHQAMVQLVVAWMTPHIIERLKGKGVESPEVQRWINRASRFASLMVATLTPLGLDPFFDGDFVGGGTIGIHYAGLPSLLEGLGHIFGQFWFQEVEYNRLKTKRQAKIEAAAQDQFRTEIRQLLGEAAPRREP